VNETEYVLYSINATTGKARMTICILDDELQSEYNAIKKSMISIFDTKSNQEVLKEYGRSFKQNNVESVSDFYVRFKIKVSELLAHGIWTVDNTLDSHLIYQFWSRLRVTIEDKVTRYLEDKDIEDNKLTMENFFRLQLKQSKE
jgi:hypothetical protein